MEEVRNGLGTEALDSLSMNFNEQGLALSKLRASTLNRHGLVSSFPKLHSIFTSVLSAPDPQNLNELAKALAESRHLTRRAALSPEQESHCMRQFASIDEMCRCSDAGKTLFKKD